MSLGLAGLIYRESAGGNFGLLVDVDCLRAGSIRNAKSLAANKSVCQLALRLVRVSHGDNRLNVGHYLFYDMAVR